MFSIQKAFFVPSHKSGNEVLRLILWIHGLMFLTTIVNLVLFSHILHLKLFTTELHWYVPAVIVYLTNETLPLFILWKGIQQKSKSLLGWYTIVKSILLISDLLITFLLKSYGPLNPKDFIHSTSTFIVTSILYALWVAINIYIIFVVYIYYKKLESPILTYLYCHLGLTKETKPAEESTLLLNNGIDSKGTPKIITIGESSKILKWNLQNPRGNSYTMTDFILNPFDVAIGVLNTGNILGEGQFGTVYKGTLKSKEDGKLKIAAKVAKQMDNSETLEMLLQEIKIIMRVGDHKNIIKFYGVTSDASIENHVAIILEFVSFGCLENFLHGNRHTFKDFIRTSAIGLHNDKPLLYSNLETHGTHSTLDLICLSLDIAKGMEHLVSKNIVHGDLACRNVLVTDNLIAKLTDFGMSRRLYTYQIATQKQNKCHLPWRWMSIEAIEDLNLSEKSDVWSYGVTLWEIFTLGEFPFDNLEWSLEIPKQIREGLLKLSRPKYSNRKIFSIMNECCSIAPIDRPTFLELTIQFEKILQEIKENPEE